MAHIEATIGLQVDDKTRHWIYFQRQPSHTSRHKSTFGGAGVNVTQPIYNGRGKDLRLDEASFELIDIPTALSTEDFYAMIDDPALKAKYHQEVELVVKEKLGCDRIFFLHQQVRNASKSFQPGVAGYAGGGPHTDSSGVSGDELALHMLKQHGDTTVYKRYLYVNLWRNISSDPIENDHLAMLDERTTAKPDDYIAKDLLGPGYTVVQYGLNARHAKHHQWYYFPKMTKDEGILFKQADSDFTLPGRTCFHMSVSDPNAGPDARPRESIELRMFCFWKEAPIDSMPTEENMYLHLKKDPAEVAEESQDSRSLWSSTVGCWSYMGFSWLFGGKQGPQAYTGNPKDYVAKLIGAVKYFDQWPQQGKDWAYGTMAAEGAEKGLVAITKALVGDSQGALGTKDFTEEQKNLIVEVALLDSTYRSECETRMLNTSKS